MKIKTLMITLLVGLLSLNTHAGFDQFNDPGGEVNLFDGSGGFEGNWLRWSEWGVADLQAVDLFGGGTPNRNFKLLPNINAYTDEPEFDEVTNWRNNGGLGPDGNVWMVATTSFGLSSDVAANMIAASFSFTVDEYVLSNRYSVVGFIQILDPDNDYQPVDYEEVTISATGSHNLSVDIYPGYDGMVLSAGWTMSGLNANPIDDWGSVTVTATDLTVDTGDTTPPSPDPMTFAVDPYAVSDYLISMTATTAIDEANVEYLFTNTVNNTSSGWQSSPAWVDAGPAAGVTTAELAIANADFETVGTNWFFFNNTWEGWGSPSDCGWTNDAGNGVVFGSVSGTQGGGYAVISSDQTDLSTSGFSAGDTVTLSADIRALAGLNGGGAILKMESWAAGSKLEELEVPIAGTTESWDNYSIDYTIADGADAVVIVVGTSTGWGGANAIDSSYIFDNVVVSKEVIVASGLTPDTLYTYQVKARDDSILMNETAWSAAVSASTNVEDTEAPMPSPMTFADTDASPVTVKLTATTASDDSEVEYYFTCTAGGGNDSGWQSSPVYYDTGLAPGATYSYTVIARDQSLAANSNTVSAVVSVTTMDAVSYELSNSLTGYTGNTDDRSFLFELEKDGLTTGSSNADGIIDLDGSGATFGDGIGFSGRNLLKTIATGYADSSLEVYATLTFSGAADLSGFIGIGQGLQTGVPDNYGVPELNLGGVNGVCAQFKDITAGSGTYNNSLFKFISGDPAQNGGEELLTPPVGSTETIRVRLTYDAIAETVNVAIHKDYTGGAFVSSQDLGTVSTSLSDENSVPFSMWDGAPVSVYVGGGEGTIVKDFEIVVTDVPLTTFDLQIEGAASGGVILGSEAVGQTNEGAASGGVILSWEGAVGQTYEVQYTTSLSSPVWNTDTTVGVGGEIVDLGGSMSVTSTVGVANAFYRFILK